MKLKKLHERAARERMLREGTDQDFKHYATQLIVAQQETIDKLVEDTINLREDVENLKSQSKIIRVKSAALDRRMRITPRQEDKPQPTQQPNQKKKQ